MNVDATVIAVGIATAPAWAKLGLTVPSPRMREEAAMEIARHLQEALDHPAVEIDRRQMALPL